jgi:hypothetical protein
LFWQELRGGGGDDERERRSPQFNGKLRQSSRMNVVFLSEKRSLK